MSFISTFDTQAEECLQQLSLQDDLFITYTKTPLGLFEVEFENEDKQDEALDYPELLENHFMNERFDAPKFFKESLKDFEVDPTDEYMQYKLKRATELFAKYQTL